MVFAIVAVMFLLLIGISFFVEQKRKREAVETAVPAKQPETEFYVHPSHTFAKIVGADTVEIGLDEFAQRAFGDVEFDTLPEVGAQLHQGDRAWTLQVGDRKVAQRMPVSGEILETRETAQGWVLKAKVADLSTELANLIKSTSVVPWLKKARAQFVADYSGELMPVLQDGGELAEGFARHLTDEQWAVFCQEFFNCEGCD